MNNLIRHRRILDKLHKTYAEKNSDYGDSFTDTMNKFGIEVGIARICDKYKRLENMALGKHMNVNESMKDCLLDMANYAIMLSMYLDEKYPNGDYSKDYDLKLEDDFDDEDFDGDFDDDCYGMNQDIADGYVNSKNTDEFDAYLADLGDEYYNLDELEGFDKQRESLEKYIHEHPREFYDDFDHWINENELLEKLTKDITNCRNKEKKPIEKLEKELENIEFKKIDGIEEKTTEKNEELFIKEKPTEETKMETKPSLKRLLKPIRRTKNLEELELDKALEEFERELQEKELEEKPNDDQIPGQMSFLD